MRIDLKKIDWLSPKKSVGIKHEVRGGFRTFYPLSALVLPKFQDTFAVLAKGIVELRYPSRDEAGNKIVQDIRENMTHMQTALDPMTVEMSKLHADRRQKTIESMFEAVMDEESMATLGLCILDSMREDFERDIDNPFTISDGKDFAQQCDLPDFFAMIVGVFRANVESFGPAGKKMARQAKEAVEGALAGQLEILKTPDETSGE